MKKSFYFFILAVLLGALLTACGSGGGGLGFNLWTWISGAVVINQPGIYGTKGVADADNVPGGRQGSVSWMDENGSLWLFGGLGRDSVDELGNLNDLWKFDGTNWTWVSGANLRNQQGVYGTKGVAHADNAPGARNYAVSWMDTDGNLWLFGGNGIDSTGGGGPLNDLWKFDGTNWTWVSGSNICSQQGVYGTKGVAHPDNVPGARNGAVSWLDADGNLWLFGGEGYDSAGSRDILNDLWKFDGTNWTWVSGSNVVNQSGIYGTKGVAQAGNVPGARYWAVSWLDQDGNLWLFGGSGRDSAGRAGNLNDLWKFDGTNWTWVSGSDVRNQSGIYGTKGTAHADNVPGARQGAISWTDTDDTLWLFGGSGYDSTATWGGLNDLWKFDGSNWTWVSGSDTILQSGSYGTKGFANTDNIPGARVFASNWMDTNGNLLLFGGYGVDSTGSQGRLNDLWRYMPN